MQWQQECLCHSEKKYGLTSDLKKKIPVARSVAANWVPDLQMQPGMIEALDEAQGIWIPKLTMKQREEKLFEKLDLSGLESGHQSWWILLSLF